MVEFWLEFEKEQMLFPVNPEIFSISREAANEIVNIVGLGDIVIPTSPGLAKISIESLFPYDVIPSGSKYFPATPIEYVNFINRAWISKKPIRFIVTELNPINILVSIERFDYDRRAGEHNDIYYTLDLVEYIHYGAKEIVISENNTTEPIATPRTNENKEPVGRSYTVKNGDSLWAITKKLAGDGAKYRELYEINKAVIGNNPSNIAPNIVLTIPESWVI